MYHAGRNRLSPDMHQSPLAQVIVTELHIAPLDCIKYVLSPGYKQPDYGAALVETHLSIHLGLCREAVRPCFRISGCRTSASWLQYGRGEAYKGSSRPLSGHDEPAHIGACIRLCACAVWPWEAGGAGGKVYGGKVLVGQGTLGFCWCSRISSHNSCRQSQGCGRHITFCVSWASYQADSTRSINSLPKTV